MSSASSAALGVTLPQCAQPSNWWSYKKSLNQSHKMSKRRHPRANQNQPWRWWWFDDDEEEKTRRGGKARHAMQTQEAKMMSKYEDEKKVYAHIKCFKCGDTGHFASRCPNQAWEEGSSNSWEVRQWEAPLEQGREGSIKEKVLLIPGKGTHGSFMSPR